MAPSAEAPLLEQVELERAVCRALRCNPADLQLLGHDERPGALVTGFLSDSGSVAVRAAVAGRPRTLHLFAKRNDGQDATVGMQCFPREAAFYELLQPVLRKAWDRKVGDTAAAEKDDDTPASPDLGPAGFLGTDSVVVLEDLARRGYRGMPANWVYDGLDIATLRQGLRALARLHAASLVAERRDGARLAELVPCLLEDNYITRRAGVMGRRILQAGGDVIADYLLPGLFGSLAVPQTPAELRRLQDETRDLFAELDSDLLRRGETVLVLNHGDAWPNNMLVKHKQQQQQDGDGDDEGHVALVDFQMMHLCPPALDVMHFLLVAARRDFRQRHLDGLLADYHGYLLGYCHERGLDLAQEFGLPAFMASVLRVGSAARCLAAVFRHLVSGDAADLAAVFADPAGPARMLLDPRARGELMSQWLARLPRYRAMQQETIEELLGLTPQQAAR